MPKVPFGYRSFKEQANDDSLRDEPPVVYQYFEFTSKEFRTNHRILIIKSGTLITNEIVIRIIESFGQLIELSLGTPGLSTSILNKVQVGVQESVPIFTGQLGIEVNTIFLRDKPLILTLDSPVSTAPIQGKGWGLIKYINLLGVRGYAR